LGLAFFLHRRVLCGSSFIFGLLSGKIGGNMHPATRQFLYGTITIIEQALGQIKAVLAAEQQGFNTGPAVAQQRVDMSKSGNESIYCNEREEEVIGEGLKKMFEETAQSEVGDDEPFQRSAK